MERKHALVGECISRASVEAARAATDADLEVALASCDYERAATIAFARAKAGTPVPTTVIARILPGIELPAITASLLAITPARAELLEVVERRRFPSTKDAGELETLVLYAACKAGAPVARIVPELRRLSARSLSAESYALLATIAASIDDPHVTAACKPIAPFGKEYARQVADDDRAMHAGLDAVLAELPAEVEQPLAAGFTVRAAKQPGRNEPCPCGSGQKYKKCCADKPQAAPSPMAGVSRDEFLAGDQLTSKHVEELPLRDIALVDITRLGDDPLIALFRRYAVLHEWTHAERCIDELFRRGHESAHEFADELVHSLLDLGEVARARPWIAKLPSELAQDFALELAIESDRERAYPALVAAVERALRVNSELADVELAYALLRAEPVLGILAARACVGTAHFDDPDLLLTLVEEKRDRLNLPPTDAAWDVLDAISEDDEKDKPAPAKLDGKLAESAARIAELERALASMRTELDAARTRPAAELMRSGGPESPLEAKVRELEGLIREGNAERRELRRQLETRERRTAEHARDESPRARRATLDEPDEGFDEQPVEPGNREITLPRFERRFTDALQDVPGPVAAEAMRTIGTLSAGDGFAWRGVKLARDMTRQVMMARVGIHHRLIFRLENGELTVLDLITREQLDTTLRRLRMK